MIKWIKDWWAKRQKAKANRELDKRIDVLLRKARRQPPIMTEEQRAQARSFVKGSLALDGIEISDAMLVQAQRDAEAQRDTGGLPYIRIKQ